MVAEVFLAKIKTKTELSALQFEANLTSPFQAESLSRVFFCFFFSLATNQVKFFSGRTKNVAGDDVDVKLDTFFNVYVFEMVLFWRKPFECVRLEQL